MRKLRTIKAIFSFLLENKKWWITPLVMVLMALGFLIVLSHGSAVGSFLYTLF